MSDDLATDLARIDDTAEAHPVGEPRTSPLVTFGLRTAALAGLAVPVGLLVGQLIAGDAAGGADVSTAPVITCCPTFEM